MVFAVGLHGFPAAVMNTSSSAEPSHVVSFEREQNIASPDSAALSLGRWLCLGTILFASGDLWPTVNVGFTFRLSQLLIMVALLVLLTGLPKRKIRLFPGALWLCAFLVWVFVTLPFSIYPERSLGYTCWMFTDVVIVLVFVQYFDSEASVIKLMRWFLISFSALAVFGLIQLALGTIGIDLFVSEWWIQDRLPRINGISYEPSYYASYLIVGWVLSLYLLGQKGQIPSPSVQRWCAVTTTMALLLSSSRMGWIAMTLWFVCRGTLWCIETLIRQRMTWRNARKLAFIPLVIGAVGVAAASHAAKIVDVLSDLTPLVQGLGLFGTASHSSDERIGLLGSTWQAFLNHPLVGAGLGALPVDIAGQKGAFVSSLADAKGYEGGVLSIEILASTGLVGMLLVVVLAASIIRNVRARYLQFPRPVKTYVAGLSWGFAWLLLLLHFNGQFLRVSIYVDLAILVCCVSAFSVREDGSRSVYGAQLA